MAGNTERLRALRHLLPFPLSMALVPRRDLGPSVWRSGVDTHSVCCELAEVGKRRCLLFPPLEIILGFEPIGMPLYTSAPLSLSIESDPYVAS